MAEYPKDDQEALLKAMLLGNEDDRKALPEGAMVRDRYEILDVLGRGRYALTYRTYDHWENCNVALKEYMPLPIAQRGGDGKTVEAKPHLEGFYDQWLEDFHVEADTLMKFHHSNINTMYGRIEDNNTVYLALEYIDGGSLRATLNQEKRLEEAALKRLLQDVLGGLKRIHREGVYHRDLTPENLVRRKDGTWVIVDFGIAREARKFKLTPAPLDYAPLEQHGKSADPYGPWSDIFIVATVAYECIGGTVVNADLRASRLNAGKSDIDPATSVGRRFHYSRQLSEGIEKGMRIPIEERPWSIEEWESLLGLEPEGAISADEAGATEPAQPDSEPARDISSAKPSEEFEPEGAALVDEPEGAASVDEAGATEPVQPDSEPAVDISSAKRNEPAKPSEEFEPEGAAETSRTRKGKKSFDSWIRQQRSKPKGAASIDEAVEGAVQPRSFRWPLVQKVVSSSAVIALIVAGVGASYWLGYNLLGPLVQKVVSSSVAYGERAYRLGQHLLVEPTKPELVDRPVGTRFRDCPTCPELIVVSTGLAVGIYEITFADWDRCVADGGCRGYRPNDRGFGRGQQPVINVNRFDVQGYLQWISEKTGQMYRLLSEAEHNYISSTGKDANPISIHTIMRTTGLLQVSYNENVYRNNGEGYHRGPPVPVGKYSPNTVGLHDFNGNVLEWLQDCYEIWSDYTECTWHGYPWTIWTISPGDPLSVSLERNTAGFRSTLIGFRIARSLPHQGSLLHNLLGINLSWEFFQWKFFQWKFSQPAPHHRPAARL